MTEALTQTQQADVDRLLDATEQINDLLDLNDDTPLAPVCDLSGDKTCESCQ